MQLATGSTEATVPTEGLRRRRPCRKHHQGSGPEGILDEMQALNTELSALSVAQASRFMSSTRILRKIDTYRRNSAAAGLPELIEAKPDVVVSMWESHVRRLIHVLVLLSPGEAAPSGFMAQGLCLPWDSKGGIYYGAL